MAYVSVEVKDYIAVVTYNRPPANATNASTYTEIRDTFIQLEKRDDVKVVIFTGGGKIFMAGNDLDEFSNFMEPGICTEYYDTIRNAYLSVKNCKYPVIGAINGAAAGAGCAFAGCCDILVAVEGAKFILSEIKVGIIGADGFASLLVPEKVLRYMAFSGNALLAEEIATYGGIHKIVSRDKLMDTAMELAREFTANARRALILWKKCLNLNYEHDLAHKFDNNLQHTISYQTYADFKEASKAFQEKRIPEYDNL